MKSDLSFCTHEYLMRLSISIVLSRAHEHVVKAIVQKSYYRTGLIREEIPLRNGQRHGVARTWHRNGQLASEEPYRNGLPHGVCRQWDEAGRLLGKYRILRGTGVQRSWHDNGRLQMEVSTVRGEFCGRNRIWLRDGTLLSERIYDHGRPVSSGAHKRGKEERQSVCETSKRVSENVGGISRQAKAYLSCLRVVASGKTQSL